MRPEWAPSPGPLRRRLARRGFLPCPASGFTLLEVMVAVAILAASGLVIIQWLLSNQDTLGRAQDRQAQARLMLDAQSLVRSINPLQRPEGRMEAGQMSLSWTSAALTPVTDGSSFTEYGPGAWQVALFRLDLVAVETATGARVRFSAVRMGQRLRDGAQTSQNRQP